MYFLPHFSGTFYLTFCVISTKINADSKMEENHELRGSGRENG